MSMSAEYFACDVRNEVFLFIVSSFGYSPAENAVIRHRLGTGARIIYLSRRWKSR
jgi:hypothetical protein